MVRGIFKTAGSAERKRVIAMSTSYLITSFDVHVRCTPESYSHQGIGSQVLRDIDECFIVCPPAEKTRPR